MAEESNQSSSVGSVENGASLAVGLKMLVAVELLLAAVGFLLAWLLSADLTWTAIAWVGCAVSAVVALVASLYPRGVEYAMMRLAAGSACRTVVPLALAVWGLKYRQPAAGPIEILVLVVFYFGGLAADSYFTIQNISPARESSS